MSYKSCLTLAIVLVLSELAEASFWSFLSPPKRELQQTITAPCACLKPCACAGADPNSQGCKCSDICTCTFDFGGNVIGTSGGGTAIGIGTGTGSGSA
jgi:hypothetical protein